MSEIIESWIKVNANKCLRECKNIVSKHYLGNIEFSNKTKQWQGHKQINRSTLKNSFIPQVDVYFKWIALVSSNGLPYGNAI